MLPATLLHELTHVLAALPAAREVQLRLRPGDGADAVIHYREGTPRWLLRAAELSPFIIGLTGGVIAAGWWVTVGTPIPSTLEGQVGVLYVCYSWALYAVLSSGDDLAGGLGADASDHTGQQEPVEVGP
jgi:hypothetical protein